MLEQKFCHFSGLLKNIFHFLNKILTLSTLMRCSMSKTLAVQRHFMLNRYDSESNAALHTFTNCETEYPKCFARLT